MREVVLLHGWGCTAAVWEDLAARLGPRFRVQAPDLPGYGARPPCEPYALESLARALARAAPRRCAAVGWSLGGLVALAWAAAAPPQVARLALVATSPCFVRRAGWAPALGAEALDGFGRALAADRRAALRRFALLQARGDRNERRVARALAAALATERAAPRALERGLEILRAADLRPLLGRVAQPALVLHGARDAIAPLAAARYLARALPAARLAVLPEAGHAPFVSEPAAAAQLLADFLDGR